MLRELRYPFEEKAIRALKAGDAVSITGRIYTGRDKFHKFFADGGKLPVDFKDGALYHCGPVVVEDSHPSSLIPHPYRVVAAGPTTSVRENPYEPDFIAKTGVRLVIGKGGMDAKTLAAMRKHGCVYIQAVGGGGAVYADAVKRVAGVSLLREFGAAEAVWHLDVVDFRGVVAMDAHGRSLFADVAEASGQRLMKTIMKKLVMGCVALGCALAGFGAQAPDSAEMKLMSFNVRHCEGMDGKLDIARTAAAINAEDPDFACLQEIDWRTARVNGVDEPAELARLTGMHATFAKAIFFAGGQYGVMMLSRQKPLRVEQLPLPGKEPRVLLLCEFADCWVGTTHLSVAGEQERLDSIAKMKRAVGEARRKKPVFLTGDWNSTPESKVLKGLGEFLTTLSDTKCQTYHGSTVDGPDGQPLDMSKFCIDYIAVDSVHAPGFRVTDAHVVEDRVTSDHAPIVATVAVPVPELPAPAVVPQPASLKSAKGVRFEKATEVTADFVRFIEDPSVAREGYDLRIAPEGIAVSASTETGRFYALETLKQLALPRLGKLAFPCLEIRDAPRFGWRGVHIDDSRHFFGKAAVKRTLDLMAFHKMNVLHWHLTDSQGWRFPVASYPELTSEAAKRPYSSNQKDLADKFEDGTYGPFAYSEADIREVVAYAAARHIRVIPEIDFPGHSRGALRAHPELLCFRPGDPKAPQGAVDNVFCLGNDETLKLFDEVFEAVCDLFPDELVHIGGDEVNKVNWEACPKCRARMKELGLKDGKALQSWQMNRTAALLAKRGKRVIGWDEMILDGQAPEKSVVMSWRGAEGGIAAAKMGLESVMTPHTACYFDYDQCIKDDPAVYPWFTCRLPLKDVYAYEPLAGIPADQQKYVLGGQCCNWAEYTCDETELQWKMWPRACATAEVFWTPAARRDFADFRRRMETHRSRLTALHVNCAPLE